MANIKSAEKRVRVTAKKTARNKAIRTGIRTAMRNFEEALAAGDMAVAEEKRRYAEKLLDKAAAKGVIHKSKASRHKSRLTRKLQSSA